MSARLLDERVGGGCGVVTNPPGDGVSGQLARSTPNRCLGVRHRT